jgi:hypothetical protein
LEPDAARARTDACTMLTREESADVSGADIVMMIDRWTCYRCDGDEESGRATRVSIAVVPTWQPGIDRDRHPSFPPARSPPLRCLDFFVSSEPRAFFWLTAEISLHLSLDARRRSPQP